MNNFDAEKFAAQTKLGERTRAALAASAEQSNTPSNEPVGHVKDHFAGTPKAYRTVIWADRTFAMDVPDGAPLFATSVTERAAAPASVPEDRLVTLLISIDRDGNAHSDVQTHDNSFAEVAKGFGAVKVEIDRVFSEQKNCPHFPKTSADAKKKIVRAAAPEVAQPAAQGESIDTPEFRKLICDILFGEHAADQMAATDAIVAHVNAWGKSLATPAPTAGEASSEKGAS